MYIYIYILHIYIYCFFSHVGNWGLILGVVVFNRISFVIIVTTCLHISFITLMSLGNHCRLLAQVCAQCRNMASNFNLVAVTHRSWSVSKCKSEDRHNFDVPEKMHGEIKRNIWSMWTTTYKIRTCHDFVFINLHSSICVCQVCFHGSNILSMQVWISKTMGGGSPNEVSKWLWTSELLWNSKCCSAWSFPSGNLRTSEAIRKDDDGTDDRTTARYGKDGRAEDDDHGGTDDGADGRTDKEKRRRGGQRNGTDMKAVSC